MKKRVFRALIIIISIILVLTLGVGITLLAMHPMDMLKVKMASAKSYSIDLSVYDVPLFGTQEMSVRVDGNVKYTNGILFGGESYTETVDGKEYKYSKSSGEWVKAPLEESEDSEELIDLDTLLKMFDPDNYEKVEGEEKKYKQKSDVVISDSIEDVVMTIEDDGFTIDATGTKTIIGIKLTLKMQIKIYNINKTTVILPEVK